MRAGAGVSGGPSSQNRSGAWHRLRALALKRDGHRCRRCGSARRLQVHHRIPRSEGGLKVLANVETLCKSCHLTSHDLANAPRTRA